LLLEELFRFRLELATLVVFTMSVTEIILIFSVPCLLSS